MRFITEFELIPPAIEDRINAYKANANFHLGNGISDSFGWKCKGEITLKAIGSEIKERHTLEIEAFPMDKWIEFKEHLFIHLKRDTLDMDYVRSIFKTLESFGKPTGK